MDTINIRKDDSKTLKKIDEIIKTKNINISSRTIGIIAIGGESKTDKVDIDVEYDKQTFDEFRKLIPDIKTPTGINLDTIGFYSIGGQSQLKDLKVTKRSLGIKNDERNVEIDNLR